MRGTIIALIVLVIHFPGLCHADEHPATDAEVCLSLLTKSADTILSRSGKLPGSTARLTCSRGIPLSDMTRKALETYVTHRGFTLTDDYLRADFTLDIAVTDTGIVLIRNESGYDRTVHLTVHIQCTDNSGFVLFASGTMETARDTISKDHARSTDDGHLFSRDTGRSVIRTASHIKTMIGTLLVISGVLAYFATR
ncbi:hypothetical protein LLG96_16635 [bacterium]|nr:hypothetical protein [bacterium]